MLTEISARNLAFPRTTDGHHGHSCETGWNDYQKQIEFSEFYKSVTGKELPKSHSKKVAEPAPTDPCCIIFWVKYILIIISKVLINYENTKIQIYCYNINIIVK